MRDLLRPQKLKKLPQQNLKVREHPKQGPYVEGKDYPNPGNFQVQALLTILVTTRTITRGLPPASLDF